MFHTSTLPRRMGRRDSSVPLSRTRIPRFVLQERHCSVHAADGFPLVWRRLCAVNVKLTMRLGIGGRLLMSRSGGARRFSPRAGEVVTQVASNRLGHRAGRGGDVALGSLREKRPAQTRECFLRALPFSLTIRGSGGDPVLAPHRQAAYWGAIARKSG